MKYQYFSAVVLCCAMFSGKLDAAIWTLDSVLHGPTPADYQYFGSSVAAAEDVIVVGASQFSTVGTVNAGAAYIFDEKGIRFHDLAPVDPVQDERFGFTVAASKSRVFVSGPEGDGHAYLFDTSNGNLVREITGSRGNFGFSSAVSDEYAVVGANRDSHSGSAGTGTAYVYDAATGDFIQSLIAPSPGQSEYFGSAVATEGYSVVVGASGVTGSDGHRVGEAYVYSMIEPDPLDPDAIVTLKNPNPSAYDDFGYSVAMNGNRVIVGAPLEDNGINDGEGAAYIFDISNGQLMTTLKNPAIPSNAGLFGYSVALSDEFAVIGAPQNSTDAFRDGAAYVFSIDTGELIQTLQITAIGAGGLFGNSVAIHGSTIVVGAYQDTSQGTGFRAGSAYIYKMGQTVPPVAAVPVPVTLPAVVMAFGGLVLVGRQRGDEKR